MRRRKLSRLTLVIWLLLAANVLGGDYLKFDFLLVQVDASSIFNGHTHN